MAEDGAECCGALVLFQEYGGPYTKLSELCRTRSNLEQIGFKKTKFYSQRYIMELSVGDKHKEEHKRLLSQDLSLLTMNKLYKQCLQEAHRRQKVASLLDLTVSASRLP